MKIIKLLFLAALMAFLCLRCRKPALEHTQYKVTGIGKNIYPFKAVQLANGSFVVAAKELDNFNLGVIICVDTAGNMLWQHELPGISTFTDIVATADNTFVVAGYNDTSFAVFYAAKFSADGAAEWSNSYKFRPASIGSVVATILPDKSIAFGMTCAEFYNAGVDSVFIINISGSGQMLGMNGVSVGMPHTLWFAAMACCTTMDGIVIGGNFTVGDTTVGEASGGDGFVVKTDFSGNLQWSYIDTGYFSRAYDEERATHCCQALHATAGGNIIEAGAFSEAYFGSEDFDDYNDMGNIPLDGSYGPIFAKTFGGATGMVQSYTNYATDTFGMNPVIIATADRGYMIGSTGNVDFFRSSFISYINLVKTDGNLNQLWIKKLNLVNPSRLFGLFETNTGYIVFAAVQSFNSTMEFAMIKTDKNGNIVAR